MELEKKGSFTFIWKIENFSHCLQSPGECLCASPEFTVRYFHNSRWIIRLYRKGPDVQLKLKYAGYYRTVAGYPITVVFQLSIMDIYGDILNLGKEKKTFRSQGEHGILPHPTVKNIYETKRSVYLPQDTLTVICSLWKTDGDMDKDIQLFSRTRIGVKKLSEVWVIDKVSSLVLEGERTTTVTFGGMDNASLILKISLDGFLREWLKIVIYGHLFTDQSVMCKILILDRFGKSVKQVMDDHTFLKNKLRWLFPMFISCEEINEKSSNLLSQDTLFLKLEFTLRTGVKYEQIESTHYGLPRHLNIDSNNPSWKLEVASHFGMHSTTTGSDKRSSLNCDMLCLYQEKTLSDFNLIAEDVIFPVHKSILCARSPVFKSMLTSDMQEGNSKSVNVPDISADTMEQMLKYVYTDVFDNMQWERTLELYYAADKYGLLSLKQKCSLSLKSRVTVPNATFILSLADRHQDDELTAAVYDFILKHDKEVLKSTEWTKFETENSQLAAITMRILYKKKLKIV